MGAFAGLVPALNLGQGVGYRTGEGGASGLFEIARCGFLSVAGCHEEAYIEHAERSSREEQ